MGLTIYYRYRVRMRGGSTDQSRSGTERTSAQKDLRKSGIFWRVFRGFLRGSCALRCISAHDRGVRERARFALACRLRRRGSRAAGSAIPQAARGSLTSEDAVGARARDVPECSIPRVGNVPECSMGCGARRYPSRQNVPESSQTAGGMAPPDATPCNAVQPREMDSREMQNEQNEPDRSPQVICPGQ
jgi:hypothetical protein